MFSTKKLPDKKESFEISKVDYDKYMDVGYNDKQNRFVFASCISRRGSLFSLEMFENIAYVMAKHADPNIPDTPEEWLDAFNTFSIYQVLPKIIELWGLNVRTDAEAKKNFVQQTVR